MPGEPAAPPPRAEALHVHYGGGGVGDHLPHGGDVPLATCEAASSTPWLRPGPRETPRLLIMGNSELCPRNNLKPASSAKEVAALTLGPAGGEATCPTAGPPSPPGRSPHPGAPTAAHCCSLLSLPRIGACLSNLHLHLLHQVLVGRVLQDVSLDVE